MALTAEQHRQRERIRTLVKRVRNQANGAMIMLETPADFNAALACIQTALTDVRAAEQLLLDHMRTLAETARDAGGA